jgi:hypothetical protein
MTISVRSHLNSFTHTLKRGYSEPLVQFLLIGSALFVGYHIAHRGPAETSKRVELSMDELRKL